MYIEFEGVTRIDSIGGGCIKAYWNHATTDFGVESYDIYIRAENPDIFQPEFLWSHIPYREEVTNAILRTEADSTTYFRNDITYFIGMVARENQTGFTNQTQYIKSSRVQGDGSVALEAPDRKIAKAV
jgi:hypothetical protein